MSQGPIHPDLRQEQERLDLLYRRLDALINSTHHSLTQVRQAGSSGTHQARSERDAFAAVLERRIAVLRSVVDRLCFGRLDLLDGQQYYVGRIGLSDDRQEKLLVDWRAPAAAPFYQATPAHPGEVLRRRHLTTSGRLATHVEDEVFDLDRITDVDRAALRGEGALLAAVTAPRTGQMTDIVSTIQAEQDEIIRDALTGVLVVQGGPGTGKTAVALHRAAYLLYTHRDRLSRSGVLILGPGTEFLSYIEQVLPSLGESGVVLATIPTLLPALDVSSIDDPAASLKGSALMVPFLRQAIQDRQRLPAEDIQLTVGSHQLTLTVDAVTGARARARATGDPHNKARVAFVKDLLRHLARLLAVELGVELTDEIKGELDAELRDSRDVRVNLNLLWMPLSPQRLLADLFAIPIRLNSAGRHLTAKERDSLRRDRDVPLTAADVPLIDELTDLIGNDGEAERREKYRRAQERAQDLDYAQQVLSSSGLAAGGLISAQTLAGQFDAGSADRTIAEHAAADPSWVYGHVVVDEAQELSAMAWRMIARRCPSRSWTVVGDIAQRGAAAGAHSWAEVLEPVAPRRWRERQLTVSYRTPGRVLAVAERLAQSGGLPVTKVVSVRPGEYPPQAYKREPDDTQAVVDVVKKLLGENNSGTIAVITGVDEKKLLMTTLTPMPSRVRLLTPLEAKGLEFDDVVVVEPTRLLTVSDRGLSDLYVALSRPTRRLVVIHGLPLPDGMADVLREEEGNSGVRRGT
ncbi:MAG: HelD family protein [Actinomycetota bacterium]